MSHFKEGDILVCIKGFHNRGYSITVDGKEYGGSGYVEGKIIVARKINYYPGKGRDVIFPADGEGGVFSKALMYYDKKIKRKKLNL